MTGKRFNLPAFLQIRNQRICDLIREIQNNFLAAFSGDDERILLKIKIVDIQADALADSDACTSNCLQDHIQTSVMIVFGSFDQT